MNMNWEMVCQRSEYLAAYHHYHIHREGSLIDGSPQCTTLEFPCSPEWQEQYVCHYRTAIRVLSDDTTLPFIERVGEDPRPYLDMMDINPEIFIDVISFLQSDYLLKIFVQDVLQVQNCVRLLVAILDMWGPNHSEVRQILTYIQDEFGISIFDAMNMVIPDYLGQKFLYEPLADEVHNRSQAKLAFWSGFPYSGLYCEFCMGDIPHMAPHLPGPSQAVRKLTCCGRLIHPKCYGAMISGTALHLVCPQCGSWYGRSGVVLVFKTRPTLTNINRGLFGKKNKGKHKGIPHRIVQMHQVIPR